MQRGIPNGRNAGHQAERIPAMGLVVGSNHCRAVGRPLFAEIEPDRNPLRVDHVWLMLDVGPYQIRPLSGSDYRPSGSDYRPSGSDSEIKVAINTISIRNREAGFDSRIRVGINREQYEELPEIGVFPHPGLDYGAYELEHNVFYEHYEHHEMENLLIDRIREAILVEVWGELYTRHSVGIHQIHCRRASCAVPEELHGRDGALRFYFAKDNLCEMLLFKFCGQP